MDEKAIFHQLTRMWTTHGVGKSESMDLLAFRFPDSTRLPRTRLRGSQDSGFPELISESYACAPVDAESAVRFTSDMVTSSSLNLGCIHSTVRRITALPQRRQVVRSHEQAYGSCLPGSSFDEAAEFERLDHLVNGRRRGPKVPLEVRFRRCPGRGSSSSCK